MWRGPPRISFLLERSLDVVRPGIEEGRKTFANTLKYVLTPMSANLGNMISMAGRRLAVPAVPSASDRARSC
jgi:Mg2+-importing ATPase